MEAEPAYVPEGEPEHNLALHGLLLGFWTTGGGDEALGGKVVRAAVEQPCCATALLRARQVAARVGLEDALDGVEPPAARGPGGGSPRYGVQALVLTPDGRDGLCVGAVVRAGAGGGVVPLDVVDPVMRQVGATVLGRFEAARPGLRWRLEWPLRDVGRAIGLPLHVAGLVALHGLRADPLLGAAGRVDADGRVRAVPGLPARLAAAAAARLDRVLLPAASRRAAEAARRRDPGLRALDLVSVAHVDDVPDRLASNLRLASE